MDTLDDAGWTSEDTILLRTFLNTTTGQKLVPRLAAATPPLFAKGDVNEILIRSGEVRGMQEAMRSLMLLAHPLMPAEQETNVGYPSLDDDAAFNDGQTILTPSTPQ